MSARDIVITGLGVVSPIGIGRDPFWSSLIAGTSGVRRVSSFDTRSLPVTIGGEIIDFDPKQYVKPRKSLKVMSRDIQLGVSAADMACASAGIAPDTVDPERFGVIFAADMIHCPLDEFELAFRSCLDEGGFDFRRWGRQALAQMYPLWMLKYLPNMPACHIAIAHDARGPNNSLTSAEVSSLLAVAEATRIIERGQADVMVVGGASCASIRRHSSGRLSATCRESADHPAAASRPFDAARSGASSAKGQRP